MSKRVYISADYSEDSGDRNVVETLNKWGTDKLHKVDFIDMAKVVSGSISSDSDCRACDLKKEFNNQINASSAVIIVIGDKTKERTAGSSCQRSNKAWNECSCTPYKQMQTELRFVKLIIRLMLITKTLKTSIHIHIFAMNLNRPKKAIKKLL